MNTSPGLRRLILTAHIATSVGWLGAVIAYLALDIVATAGQDLASMRAAFFGMEAIIVHVILPLALASVLIGIVNALSAPWGLLQHYWVVVKLGLTFFAITILLLEVQNVGYMAEVAATGADPRALPGSLPHSIGGLVVLVIVIILSVFKPRGLTRRGWRKQQERQIP
ncbi:MAG TPA: hypothetical protein VJS12_14800 [Steroidobacteraceae bacterium]|nr:hypothetical protein [Steroidobacteraceae bacterium]